MDRRTTLKWVLAAAASVPSLKTPAWGASVGAPPISAHVPVAQGYGTDPKLLKTYQPGELWPLTFTPEERRFAAALSDLIIPADATSPSASKVGVVDFIDEWISAPYKKQQGDRKVVLEGFKWLNGESSKRFSRIFVELSPVQQRSICDDISYAPKAKPPFAAGAQFFARYRDLTAGGFYTTAQGRKDLQYFGNTPLASFPGPPPEVLKAVGLV